jgi:hypothetical protein
VSGQHHIPDDPADGSPTPGTALPAATLVHRLTGGHWPIDLVSTRHDGTQRRETDLAVVR